MTEFWKQRWFKDALPYAAGALAAAGAVAGIGAASGWFDGGPAAGALAGGEEDAAPVRRAVSVALGEPVRSISSGGAQGALGSLTQMGGTYDPSLPLPPPSPPGEGILSRVINNGIPGVQSVTQMIARNPELAMTAALAGGAALGGGGGGSRPRVMSSEQEAEERRKRDLERWNSYQTERLRPISYSGPSSPQGERRYFAAGGILRQGDAIRGEGDGMSDDIPAVAVGQDGSERQIYVADGEYIIAADVVSGLGNGSSEAGVRLLDEFQRRVRERRATQGEQPKALDASRVLPA